jgi:hypothetical protein
VLASRDGRKIGREGLMASSDIKVWLDAWRTAQAELFAMLDALGATEDAYTVTVRLRGQPIQSEQQFSRWLLGRVGTENWDIVTTSPINGQRYAYAMPVAERRQKPLAFLFVEIHTVLLAWWLTTVWRARQLTAAGLGLAHGDQAIAAAACVRPLVETAAAFWVDARKVADAWAEIKKTGDPASSPEALARRQRMVSLLTELTWGAKFDERAPRLKETFGRVSRSNVLGQVEKLGKAVGDELQEDYQWLCSTVHPSLGNTFAFSAPSLVHDTHTHMQTWFCGVPIHIAGPSGESSAERTVQVATARGAVMALTTLRVTLDAALRVIDDVGLTTRAPEVSAQGYWRNLERGERNDSCPCRSGRKAKRCIHEWGVKGPDVPKGFEGVLPIRSLGHDARP